MVRSEGARWLSSPSVEYALLKKNEISIQCPQVTHTAATAASCNTERRRLIASPSAAALAQRRPAPAETSAIAAVLSDSHLGWPRAVSCTRHRHKCCSF